MVAIAGWLLALEALSLLSWPLARRALPGTLDGGWAASRVMSIVLLSVAIGVATLVPTLAFDRTTLVLVAHAAPSRRWPLALAGCAAVVVLAEVFAHAAVAALLSALACALAVLAWRALHPSDSARSGLLIICAVGAGLIVLPNLLFVDDYFGSPMNTIFKSHFQALVFLAVGLPPLMSMLPRPAIHGGERLALWLRKGAVYAGLLTLVYVPLGVFTRAALSPPGGTLDALAFLQASAPADRAAIDWLRSSAPAGSVIVEAAQADDPIGVWRVDVGRFSAFSGQHAVLGWREHEQQWRGRLPVIDRRLADVDAVYAGSVDAAADALARYGVRYVVVGQTEHARYGADLDARFRDWLEPAFQAGETTVYQVPEQLSARAEAQRQ